MSRSAPEAPSGRLHAEERREALLDVARVLVDEGGPALVSMGTVAERAEVTRALVYKHFANRDDILSALYRREARALDRSLRRQVADAPDGLEPKLRAFIHSVLEAVDTHGGLFVPLRPFGQDPVQRREQRAWDRRTTRYFAELAGEELGLDEAVAKSAMGMLLSGISSLIEQARADRRAPHRAMLEDLFVEMAMVSLTHLARRDGRR
jgi:AcrR family transcriptional regulator